MFHGMLIINYSTKNIIVRVGYYEHRHLMWYMKTKFLLIVLFYRILKFLKQLSLYLTSSIRCLPVDQTLLQQLLVMLLKM